MVIRKLISRKIVQLKHKMEDSVSGSRRYLKEFWIPDYILNLDSEPEECSHIPECPVIVLVNSKSGGQLGGDLLQTYRSLLNKDQVNQCYIDF